MTVPPATETGQLPNGTQTVNGRQTWLNQTVFGIVAATFFSDFSHEMCTAVLPLYLASVGLGAASLGLIEGVADFVVSLSKLGGGVLGHHVRHKRPWAALGYLTTTIATSAMGLVSGAVHLLVLRTVAWCGRGFRGPLRDYLLSDAVEKQFYGRAYGLERAGDMLGAVAGPLAAAFLVWAGLAFHWVILLTAIPGLIAVAAFCGAVRERPWRLEAPAQRVEQNPRPAFPLRFWLFLIGVTLFGLGDFSRTFVILLAKDALNETTSGVQGGALSLAILLYMIHNAISAVAAYPTGHLGDRVAKIRVLTLGYGLGVATNVLLAMASSSIVGVAVAVLLSGVYIAVEETIEKAAAAELLPRSLRSLGFGILASANAVGDMVSSIVVGFLLESGHPRLAFGLAAGFGMAGLIWTAVLAFSKPTLPEETTTNAGAL